MKNDLKRRRKLTGKVFRWTTGREIKVAGAMRKNNCPFVVVALMNLKVKQTLIGCRKLDILMGLLIQRLQKERKNNQEETEDGQVKRYSL